MDKYVTARGKKATTEEWIEGYPVQDGLKRHLIAVPTLGCNNITFYPVAPETISYFTGLQEILGNVDGTAKAGKKIFFGDILLIESEEDGNGTWLVCSDYNIFCLNFEHLSGSQVVDNLDSAKIIGNRWDNPELLSKTASTFTFSQT